MGSGRNHALHRGAVGIAGRQQHLGRHLEEIVHQRLEVRVGPDDMGRVIGKRGRVANAIRTVVRAAAVHDDVNVDIEFED